MHYIERRISEHLFANIKQQRSVVLTGARQTGKTTLCEELLPCALSLPYTYISFDDPDERLRFQSAAISILESIDTELIILDEVQKVPFIFDPLKYVIDKNRKKEAQKKVFVLTGSSQFTLLKQVKETLAGRVALLHLFPFSLAEALQSDEPCLLTKIWQAKTLTNRDRHSIVTIPSEKQRKITRIINEHKMWGGYPPLWQREREEDKYNWLKDYRKTYVERDLSDVGQVANLDNFILAQKMLAARTGQILSISEVARDLSLAVNTVKRYINLLTLTFQCALLQPYFENIGKRLIKSPKIYFLDTGLIKVILGQMSLSSGTVYESWVFSELIKWKQLQPIEPELYFYRTAAGMEIDFLIAGHDSLLPVEVKLSSKISSTDARSILSFMESHKKTAPLGIIVYPGKEISEVGENVWAVPDWRLFS